MCLYILVFRCVAMAEFTYIELPSPSLCVSGSQSVNQQSPTVLSRRCVPGRFLDGDWANVAAKEERDSTHTPLFHHAALYVPGGVAYRELTQGPRQQGAVTSPRFPPASENPPDRSPHLCHLSTSVSHTHTHTDPLLHMRPLQSQTRQWTNPRPDRILRTPIIPRYLSWLFPTWSTCCLTGIWPHSTPISWVPAFDFHCGLTGPLIMQRCGVRSLALIAASCPTGNPRPPGEHVLPKLKEKQSFYL